MSCTVSVDERKQINWAHFQTMSCTTIRLKLKIYMVTNKENNTFHLIIGRILGSNELFFMRGSNELGKMEIDTF